VAVTPIYYNPRFNFNRAYISGFVGSVGVSSLAIVGNNVSFDYLFPNYHVDLRLKTVFQAPNTNNYTLDFIFDMAASQVYFMGTPIAAGVGIKFWPMTTEPTFRIQVLATLSVDETQKADLFPLAGYWRPLWT
jgi:hypothetical protein